MKTTQWMSVIEKTYPLVDLGMDRRACQEYIASTGHEIPWPSNCTRCPYQSKQELLWLSKKHPELFDELVQMELAKLEKFAGRGVEVEKNLGMFCRYDKKQGRAWLVTDQLKQAEAQYGSMTDEELDEYKFSHGHCVMSKY